MCGDFYETLGFFNYDSRIGFVKIVALSPLAWIKTSPLCETRWTQKKGLSTEILTGIASQSGGYNMKARWT